LIFVIDYTGKFGFCEFENEDDAADAKVLMIIFNLRKNYKARHLELN
jgi:hypothetical protein